jgi:hypothetical protein
MTDSEKQIGLLFTAELQFRLASAVRLATSLGTQPIDLPITWTHGDHLVRGLCGWSRRCCGKARFLGKNAHTASSVAIRLGEEQ